MSTAIDVILVLLIVFFAWRGYAKGFIRGIIGILAIVISIYGANLAASAFSGEFTGMFEPFVGGIVSKAVNNVFDSETAQPTKQGASLTAEKNAKVYDICYAALRNIGVSETPAKLMAEKVSGEQQGVGKQMTDTLTKKLCDMLAYISVFAVAFILIAIIFAVIGNIFNLAFSIPGIEGLDRILGLVLGILKGLIIIYVIAVIVRYLGLFSAETVEKTVLLRYILNSNPLASILGI